MKFTIYVYIYSICSALSTLFAARRIDKHDLLKASVPQCVCVMYLTSGCIDKCPAGCLTAWLTVQKRSKKTNANKFRIEGRQQLFACQRNFKKFLFFMKYFMKFQAKIEREAHYSITFKLDSYLKKYSFNIYIFEEN